MIDADGNARITDFGLAGLAEEFGDDELAAGTPAYMAPEQLEGQAIHYPQRRLFTRPAAVRAIHQQSAFEAATLGELLELRRSNTTPTTPTSIVKDLDPLVEV